MEWHFRKEMPRHFEFPRQNSRRYAAVPHAKHGTRFAREPMTKYKAVSHFAKSKWRNANQIWYNEIANCRCKVRHTFSGANPP